MGLLDSTRRCPPAPPRGRAPSKVRTALLLALAGSALLASGCTRTFALRLDSPAGATLHIPKGEFTPARSLPIPFIATFQPGAQFLYYPVTLTIPAAYSARYGGAGNEVRLHGRLYIYNATQLTENRTVRLPIPDQRITSLITGQVAEITQFVFDPSEPLGETYLARIVLRTSPF